MAEDIATKQKGAITVQLFTAQCLARGAIVSIPVGDNQPYDLIVQPRVKGAEETRLYYVEVRTSHVVKESTGWHYCFNWKNRRHNTKESQLKNPPARVGFFVVTVTKDKDGNEVWFFIDSTRHEATSNCSIYPDEPKEVGSGRRKHNYGKNAWELIGLPENPLWWPVQCISGEDRRRIEALRKSTGESTCDPAT